MKQYVFKISAFSLGVLLFILFIEHQYRSIPNDYSYKSNYIETHREKIKVLTLGASHCYRGINPAYFNLRCFNFSLVSQSIDYDYFTITKYIDVLPNLEYVILPINYITFSYKLEEGIEHWRKYRYLHYMHLNAPLTKSDLFNPDRYLSIKQEPASALINHLYQYWFHNQTHITCDTNGWGELSAEEEHIDPEKISNYLKASAKETANRHINYPFNAQNNMQYLDDIIKLCRKNQCKLILITPPATSYYI